MISSFDDAKIEEILGRLDRLERRLNVIENQVFSMDFASIVSTIDDVRDIKTKMKSIRDILY